MAQSGKHPMLDFGSGRDLGLVRSELRSNPALGMSLLKILSPSAPNEWMKEWMNVVIWTAVTNVSSRMGEEAVFLCIGIHCSCFAMEVKQCCSVVVKPLLSVLLWWQQISFKCFGIPLPFLLTLSLLFPPLTLLDKEPRQSLYGMIQVFSVIH